MIKRLVRVASASVLLFVFILESSVPANGQSMGTYGRRQGRRVGRVTLPTPPFNPGAGVLDTPGGRARNSPKTSTSRAARRGDRTANRNTNPGTSRRRRARRGRNTRPGPRS